MKFVHKHRADILRILQKHQLTESMVSFTKKRGRIYINHLESGDHFAYLRKKETRLDPVDHQWRHAEWFKIKTKDTRERDVENWDQVINAFDQWIGEI